MHSPQHLAVDSTGNVYSLGDEGSQSEDYPLLIKHSREGRAIAETLSTSNFSALPLKYAAVLGGDKGDANLFVKNDRVIVWIPLTEELFTFDLDLKLVSRVSLADAVRTMLIETSMTEIRFENLAVNSKDEVIVQVSLWSKDGRAPGLLKMARIGADGTFKDWIESRSGERMHRFLGLTSDDKNIFLESPGNQSVKAAVQ